MLRSHLYVVARPGTHSGNPRLRNMKTLYAKSAAMFACVFIGFLCGSCSSPVAGTVTSVTVTPATASVPAGMTQQFTAEVATTGSDVSQIVTWQVTGDGTISTSGRFTAGSSAGSATITAVSNANTSVWGSASVTVTQSNAFSGKRSDAQFPPIYVPSGENIYKQFCAACHGADAKGHGPTASMLKIPPPDLTTLARRHGGQFPDTYVSSILLFGPGVAAHGSTDMPTWGTLFLFLNDKQNDTAVKQRVKNLCDYLASLQEK